MRTANMLFLFLTLTLSLFSSSSPSSSLSSVCKQTGISVSSSSGRIILPSVDGHIYALDMRTGKLLWSADSGGAMISSQGFIPGIDGALYSIEESDAGLVRAPLTVKDLVHSAPFRSENLAYVGNKRASLFAVDLDSGKIFDRLLDKEKECGLIEEEESKILLLSRTDFEIQAFEADSGKMSWNASFAEFRFFDQLSTLNPTSIYREKWIPVLASTAAGGVRAYNPCTGEQLWDALLPSAISDAFVQMDSGETIRIFHFYMNSLPFNLGGKGSKDLVASHSEFYVIGRLDGPKMQPFLLKNPSSEDQVSHPVKDNLLLLPGSSSSKPNVQWNDKNVLIPRDKDIKVISITGPPSGEKQTSDHFGNSVIFVIDFSSALLITIIVILLSTLAFYIRGPEGILNLYRRMFPSAVENKPIDHSNTNSEVLDEKSQQKGVNNELVCVGKVVVDVTKCLGTGSQGTIVYTGLFEGRPVAVKRLLKQFHENATKEISLLMDSDHHPNVIRYFAQESDGHFVYVALERCAYSLSDAICGNKSPFLMLDKSKRPSRDAMRLITQIFNGVSHLHKLGIVHRDIKPQNILLTPEGTVKIADMGLGKKLEGSRNSFDTYSFGSAGWHAPETLVIRQTLEYEPLVADEGKEKELKENIPRLTRAVDNFSLGCVIYFVLTNGKHPFGESFERDSNILKGVYDNSDISHLPSAEDLVKNLIQKDPVKRMSCDEALLHPFFWNEEQKLDFICLASDRVETEDPDGELRTVLESFAPGIVGTAWNDKLYDGLLANLGKYRKYNYGSVRDLLRVIRNKKNHYRDLPPDVQTVLGNLPDEFFFYFSERFPKLLIFIYEFMGAYCSTESVFFKIYGSLSKIRIDQMKERISFGQQSFV